MMINHEYSAENKMISIMIIVAMMINMLIIVVMMILDNDDYDIADIDDAVQC